MFPSDEEISHARWLLLIFIAIIILLVFLILETRAILDKIKRLTEKIFPFVFGGRFIVI